MGTCIVTEALESRPLERPSAAIGLFAQLRPWLYGFAALLALTVMGTWLVWFSAYIQRQFAESDVRAACRRVMPQTAERCFDTVVIQRGGVNR